MAPAAARQMTPEEYDTAVQEIINFIETRTPVIEEFLARPE
jgi:hypothetical protein